MLDKLVIEIVKNRNIVSKHLGGTEFYRKPYENVRIALKFKVITRK